MLPSQLPIVAHALVDQCSGTAAEQLNAAATSHADACVQKTAWRTRKPFQEVTPHFSAGQLVEKGCGQEFEGKNRWQAAQMQMQPVHESYSRKEASGTTAE